MTIENITGLENPTQIAKLLQALIDQKSTIDLDNLSEEGQAKFTALQNAINTNSNSITTINNELANKLEAEVLKAQNGYIKFSNLVSLQWGIGGANTVITYPITFSTKRCIAIGIHQGTGSNTETIVATDHNFKDSLSQTKFFISTNQNYAILWFAIGY